ncbi:hypothetical protein B4U37_19650 [Sutcliffiella horikoshii]|uniref:Restriction endonuclease type IV Mrr domain-containing protein n=1 Tax=Sutcliffiella horikoshii TaxID=79883 RepID=A0ABN4ZPX6_9BACI|nr:hypothetical protein [Sutcliffiella horikoshii]ART78116.1 hypothetical protein B4U37_19650 [Sutcliffiella horikoshii]
MVKYKDDCIEMLKSKGPLLGSELNKYLVERCSIKPNNARQIILRLKNQGAFYSTDPVKFRHNQVLYFLPSQSLKSKLKEIFPDHAVTIQRVYQALVEEQGFLFWSEFGKISAGVVDPSKSERKTAKEIFDDLYNLGIVEKIEFNGIPVIVAKRDWVPNVDASQKELYKRVQDLSFNQQFTKDLLNWLEKMNFVGWNSSYITDVDDYEQGYNGFYCDAISYCYLWGLYRTNNKDELYEPSLGKAGSPVVIESILHRKTKRHDISGLINRVSNLYGPVKGDKNFKIIPICFVDTIETDAYELARARGIMVMMLRDVFGTKMVESLKAIREVDPQNVDPIALAKILDNASETGQDGKFGSLKGYVFNFLIASVFSEYGYKPRIGVKYEDTQSDKKCECDIVVSVDEDYIIACEVKGYNKGIEVLLGSSEEDEASVKKFFEKTCRIIQNRTGKTVIPVFITSASFSEDALLYLEKRNNGKKIKRILEDFNFPSSVYYDREALMKIFSNKSKFTEHKRVLKEFFIDLAKGRKII